MSGDIFINIDSILLRGLGRVDRHALAEAVQQALMEQLSSNVNLTASNSPQVRINISLPSNFGTEQLGKALGQSLSGIISNTTETQQTRGGQDHA